MKIKAKELRIKTTEQLLEMKKTAELLVICSQKKMVQPKIKPEQRKVPKKLIARINTILKERDK